MSEKEFPLFGQEESGGGKRGKNFKKSFDGIKKHAYVCARIYARQLLGMPNARCFTLLNWLLYHKTTFCFLLSLQHSAKRRFV